MDAQEKLKFGKTYSSDDTRDYKKPIDIWFSSSPAGLV